MGDRVAGADPGASDDGPRPVPSLYLNGSFVPLGEGRVSIEDRGLQFGDGVYEMLKLMGGRLLWLEDHLARLEWSLREVRMGDALREHDLSDILPRLVELSGVRAGTVYVQVTRGGSPRDFALPEGVRPTVLAYVRETSFPTVARIKAGLVLHVVEDQRWARCDIKSTNLLAAVLAKAQAVDAGADEALYVGSGALVREGGSSNVFVVVDGVVRTHPADNRILAGITRGHVLELARAAGLAVEETAVTVADLGRADEVFIVSTTRDVMPVLRVTADDGPHLEIGGGVPGPITMLLADAIRARIADILGLERPTLLA